jgi:aminomethyltransferase
LYSRILGRGFSNMKTLKKTVLNAKHRSLGATMIDFNGWDMPLYYPTGIVEEHLATRKKAGLFDISHMGRFIIRGPGALAYLNHVLTNNAGALDPRFVGAQYTLIPNEEGGVVDDAFLYRFTPEPEYLLVVNAANTEEDWRHLNSFTSGFGRVELCNTTEDLGMFSLQGPKSRQVLENVIESTLLPEPARNTVSIVTLEGTHVKVSRTGYTGEPLGFELFFPKQAAPVLWDKLVSHGACPAGLGSRDTLRLEASLPLCGQEYGLDLEGHEMPLLAFPMSKLALSFSPLKGDFVGRSSLMKQFEAFEKVMRRDFSLIHVLPRLIRPVAMLGRGVARRGDRVFREDKPVGYLTSGTMIPHWVAEGQGLSSLQTERKQLRSIGLAYMDSAVKEDDRIKIEIRGRKADGVVVRYHLRSEAPPYAWPIVVGHELEEKRIPQGQCPSKALRLAEKAIGNTLWRQQECINLIPSEITPSPLVRLLSVTDPAFRYAEHRKMEAFYKAEVYFYQGTAFIEEVEQMLEQEMKSFLGCEQVEMRLVSGQMANTAVFSGMVDYLNRIDRKSEPRRIGMVMNNHIGKGGHLSAQPMGALKDFVARNPLTERSAVINFPVHKENPYKIDVPATLLLIEEFKPKLIILGKSMVLHKEPVGEIRKFVDARGIDTVILYDMAHVLGLVGPHFQEPFKEGAHLVTGSTHKTFFGTQRGVIGSSYEEHEERFELWESIPKRTFPGSVSNHHLGTLLGLLMAAYEMNHFKEDYQPRVVANAKAFARALKECGLDVAGDPGIDFTETHQVVVRVGYARGPEMARRLEANNIVCNYQGSPGDEGFTAAGALRMGVAEMTRFGMGEESFRTLAGLIRDVVVNNADVIEPVKVLRKDFQELRFSFKGEEFTRVVEKLHSLL